MRKLYKRIYRYFAVKHPGIRREYGPYVKEHMEEHRNHPWKHRWMLIRLNWHYRVLGRKDTLYYDGTKHRKDAKLPYLEGPESEISKRRNPIHLARELISSYDVISFDIFDTLILRPFSKPADLFMLIGKRLNQAEFYRIRTDAEKRAREKAKLEKGSSEITIRDIYAIIQDRTGIPIEQGVQTEFEMELQYCFANPYMKRVFRLLQEHEKTIVIVSDMYLPHDMMSKLLENAGYTGYDKLYVSCDYGCSKRSKSLYQYVKRDYPYQKIVHIGDNRNSDIDSAQQIGLNTIYYKNCHEIGNPYRADGFSPLVGSAYAGIVNTHLHNGVHTYSPYYEYGFTYGGLYIFGFCNWMHQKAKEEGIEKILFLSRDGAIYQRVFNKFFGDVPNEYFLWSRIANTKYTLLKNREDFLKRMVQYRSKSIVASTVKALLRMLSLEMFIELLPKYNLKPETLVTPEVVQQLDRFFIENWELICKTYEPERQMVKDNLASKIGNAKKVAIVDVGWLGSGPMGLKYLIEEEYQWNCRVYWWQRGHHI